MARFIQRSSNRMSRTLRSFVAKAVFRVWPTYIGVERLMSTLDPPVPSNETIVKKLSGFPLKLRFSPNTYMGKFLYYRGMYEEGVIKKLSRLLAPGMTFVDVGASIGVYSLVASHLVGEGGKVIAFEPQIEQCVLFQENLRLNNLSNVTLRTLAVGKLSGVGSLYQVSQTNVGEATLRTRKGEAYFGRPAQVSIRTLDEVLSELGVEVVHGLKIDTEGAELEVLESFHYWLENKPPGFIFIECIEDHLKRFGSNSAKLISYLRSYRYEIYCLHHGRWHSIKSVRDHEKYGLSADFLALRAGDMH